MWDSFDLFLFKSVKGLMVKYIPLTTWTMGGVPIGGYLTAIFVMALIGQAAITIVNNKYKGD